MLERARFVWARPCPILLEVKVRRGRGSLLHVHLSHERVVVDPGLSAWPSLLSSVGAWPFGLSSTGVPWVACPAS